MLSRSVDSLTEARQASLRFVERLFGNINRRRVAVRLWDGTVWPDASEAPATVVLKHPDSLRRMFSQGSQVRLAEAYLHDDFDVQGDLQVLLAVADDLARDLPNVRELADMARDLRKLPHPRDTQRLGRGVARLRGRQHSPDRDREAVQYHYDLSNEFFALWLDPRMVYSCAYFRTSGDSLQQAQENKLDYICQKLRLKPGDRLLDIGCGWGGLIVWAAENYGVSALGITLSEKQAALASDRIHSAGLDRTCRVELRDYREIGDDSSFDKIVSVGMFEHVGADLLPAYFRQAFRLLKPRGVFLNHGIASSQLSRGPGRDSFLRKYVFPDGELVPLNVSLRAAEEQGFEVRDLESLREHYQMTIECWVSRLEQCHEESRAFVSEPEYRAMRLYLAASAYGFGAGSLNVYQSLLCKRDERGESGLPLTREDWYSAPAQSTG